MDKKIIKTASFLGMLAIILGAFGAHELKKALNIEQLATFETGVKYQMYHALFLLFIGLTEKIDESTKNKIFYATIFGVIMFSGSIYLLATKNITNLDFSIFGIVTPIGGLFLIAAWFLLFYKFMVKKS
jgi:uncharacterized membrane protein YgdD (TMEM256/DUF423 family)